MSLPNTSVRDGRRRRVCVTPVRNEAWILDRFLAAVQLWASDVIVADQGSTDGTLGLLQRSSNVSVVINDSPIFDESHRQRLLVDRARQVPGDRILIGLDADEALSANFSTSKDWERLEDARPGTIVRLRWVNVLPGFKQAWIPRGFRAFGFIDDGSEHKGKRIHSPRVPQPEGAPVIDLDEVVVLHFQYVAWERMLSKQRWYQVWELARHHQKSPLQIFREYHHMHGGWREDEIHSVQPEWLEGYDRAGIDFRSSKSDSVTWWDEEIVQLLREYGPDFFRKLAIWDSDWNDVASRLGVEHADLSDPRSLSEKVAHRVLSLTQAHRGKWVVRAFERGLRLAGW